MQSLFTLHSFRKRILALITLVSFLFCALVVRLFVVQIMSGRDLQLRATDQWTRDLAIIAPRGDIYDSTGSRLAVSYTTYNVYVRAREVENAQQVAEYLSNLLGLSYLSVYEKTIKKNVSEVLIKLQVSPELAESIYQKNLTMPLAVVIGSEGKGVRPSILEKCDGVITLPLEGKVNSLNASVACGIVVFEILRQRKFND